jgi:hypothetical protein
VSALIPAVSAGIERVRQAGKLNQPPHLERFLNRS